MLRNSVEYVKSKKIKPLEHQKLVSKFLLKPVKGLLIFHSVGSGKTLTAILSLKSLLEKYPDKKGVIITPASLVTNFEDELNKTTLRKDPRITITSYLKFVNSYKKATASYKGQKNMCKNTIFIIDEAHHFNQKGVMSNIVKKCARSAFKVILLSATPIINDPMELSNLLYMISPYYLDERTINERLRSIIISGKITEGLFKCKVSIFKNTDTKNYPTSKEHIIKFTMNPEYYYRYMDIQENYRENLPEIFENTKNLEFFLNGIRRAANTLKEPSPKIDWVLNKVKEGQKTVIYSNWKTAGLNLVKKVLNDNKIPFGEVSGSVSKEKKDLYVKQYNSGTIKVLLISASGAEGLDLKATRNIIILEPHWNLARIEQVIGRGIRYRSHQDLPLKDRKVDIYHLILQKPEKKLRGDKIPSSDDILYKLSELKNRNIINFYNELSNISIEKDKECR